MMETEMETLLFSEFLSSQYPYWSCVGFLVPFILLFVSRKVCKSFRHKDLINECASSVLWLLWCFEIRAVNTNSNYTIGLIVHFTALVLQSSVYQGAFANPAVLLARSLQNKWSLRKTFSLLAAQLMALPISILIVIGEWKLLSVISRSHEYMSTVFVPNDFISVSPFEGFFVEALATFLLSLSPLIASKGFLLDLVSTINYISIEYVLGSFSGAFCNPLSATVFCLFYHKQSWLELIVVYWCGSVTGAVMAWKLFLDKPRDPPLMHKTS